MTISGEGVHWLVFEGLLPLFGAAVIFLIWGGFLLVTASDKSKVGWPWGQAADPMGWLYGVAALSMQIGLTSLSSGNSILAWTCRGLGIASVGLLLAAMTNRGADAGWKPRRKFQGVVVALIIAILIIGYKAHCGALVGGGR
jgi:hypothetical protein